MPSPDVVVIGAGQAGFQFCASLRELGHDGRITLIGDEPGLPYQRPPLSKGYLTGTVEAGALLLRREGFFAQSGIDYREATRAVAVDRAAREVRLETGEAVPYHHLVLATGTRERRLPVPGADLDGVLALRTRADAELLRARLDARRVVVIGAGFIGLELASVMRKRGAAVHVLELAARPMGRALSPPCSAFFARAHAERGTVLAFGCGARRIIGEDGRAVAVETAAGVKLEAELVLVGIGVLPNVELAAEAGLAVDDGIVVDEHLLTTDPAVSAIGDCARYPSAFTGTMMRLESVQNAVDQARCVAARLVDRPAPYAAVPWFWSDQGDLRLQIAGLTMGHDREVTVGDVDGGKFSVFCFRGGRLAGIESVNRPGDHMIGRRLLAGRPSLTAEEVAAPGFDLKAYATAAASVTQS